jgi:aryl-alcohol dehydrogenase-like predicted oxidoreductase
VWSPLASGVLTGKYSGGAVPEGSRLSLKEYQWLKDLKLGKTEQLEAADRLAPVAARLGCTLAQLAIAWCLVNPNVSTVILGATSLAQLHENLDALAVLPRLTPEVVAEIEAIVMTKPALDRVTIQVTNLRK